MRQTVGSQMMARIADVWSWFVCAGGRARNRLGRGGRGDGNGGEEPFVAATDAHYDGQFQCIALCSFHVRISFKTGDVTGYLSRRALVRRLRK